MGRCSQSRGEIGQDSSNIFDSLGQLFPGEHCKQRIADVPISDAQMSHANRSTCTKSESVESMNSPILD